MIFTILYSLDSFQIVPKILEIYYKYCHVSTLKTCNIGLEEKHVKPNINYISSYSFY